MKKNKIAIITATRAEYGILYPLIKKMLNEPEFETQLIVTGTHLVKKYGETVTQIEKDYIPINHKISIMGEDEISNCEVISRATAAFEKIYISECYDAIVVLGDRYELFGICIPALLHRIPILHIHGGEKSEGAVDEKIRHAITKLASIHFATLLENSKRLIQMGETPKYVFSVGALGIDNIVNMKLLTVEDLAKALSIDFNKKDIAVVTYHPVTMNRPEDSINQIDEIFQALIETNLLCIVTMPNSDTGSDFVLRQIYKYVDAFPNKFYFRKSLGQLNYLSAIKNASIVLGNSSSGIIETASFQTPTVDIGDRQKGRFSPKNVIHCDCKKEDIKEAISNALSKEFNKSLVDYKNPYGDGHTADMIIDVIKSIDFDDELLLKKQFNDLNFEV